jgi:hypothetical protein
MQENYIKVKDHPNLVRDKRSNAILNIDNSAYNKYKQERDQKLQEKKEYEQLKKDVSEIKDLLLKILEKK